MISKEIFTYVDSKHGKTQDGEVYFAINVIDKRDKKSLSFIAKNPSVIDKLKDFKFIDFQDVKLVINFYKDFNTKTRFSNWKAELIDIESNGINK